MNRTAVTWSIAIVLAAGTAPWARAEGGGALGVTPSVRRVTLETNGAAPADVAQRLGEMLGAEIRFDGTLPETLSLSFSDLPPLSALDKVAAAVGGKWERIYRFSKSDTPSVPPAPLGQKLTLRVTDMSCARAAAMVAKMTRAKVETEGPAVAAAPAAADEAPAEAPEAEAPAEAAAEATDVADVATGDS